MRGAMSGEMANVVRPTSWTESERGSARDRCVKKNNAGIIRSPVLENTIHNNALFSSGFTDEGITITKSPYDNIFIMKRHPTGKRGNAVRLVKFTIRMAY